MFNAITKAIWLVDVLIGQKIFFQADEKFWKYTGAVIFILGAIILIF